MRRSTLVILGFLLFVNAIALAGVVWNRSGEPAARVQLTDRELPVAWRTDEDSGVALRLVFNEDGVRDWFDRDKLAEIGFAVDVPVDGDTAVHHYRKLLPRRAWIVLEYAGPAWEAWIDSRAAEVAELERVVETGEERESVLEERRRRHERDLEGATRLFAVDVGPDPFALRERFPDRARHLVVPATVRIHAVWDVAPRTVADGEQPPAEERRVPGKLYGTVDGVLVTRIHVPTALDDALRDVRPRNRWQPVPDNEDRAASYAVTLLYGKRGEPWIETVEPL